MNRLQMAVQLVLISLVLSLTACGGADKALAERAGYYKATNVVQNGEELAQGVLSGDEESIERAKSMLGEDNLADYPEDASAQTEDGYTLPDMSDESHEDAGYYSIYAYTENGTRYSA